MIIVLTTVSDAEEGRVLARSLVERNLAACVQIFPPMTSVYKWEEKIQEETEHLLLIKTSSSNWESVSKFISETHSYAVPEIVAINASEVSEPYLKWLCGELAGS
jgi:periplasmic divalent cation tolerance protein